MLREKVLTMSKIGSHVASWKWWLEHTTEDLEIQERYLIESLTSGDVW